MPHADDLVVTDGHDRFGWSIGVTLAVLAVAVFVVDKSGTAPYVARGDEVGRLRGDCEREARDSREPKR